MAASVMITEPVAETVTSGDAWLMVGFVTVKETLNSSKDDTWLPGQTYNLRLCTEPSQLPCPEFSLSSLQNCGADKPWGTDTVTGKTVMFMIAPEKQQITM